MSPEQAKGEGHKVDGRSDVYSLGVILFELLTGELPFRGNTRMMLHQVLHDEPQGPRCLNDRIPRDLETICLKAMAKEPGRRYESACTFSNDLGRFLKGEPILARRPSVLRNVLHWLRQRPTTTVCLILPTFTLIFMGIVLSLLPSNSTFATVPIFTLTLVATLFPSRQLALKTGAVILMLCLAQVLVAPVYGWLFVVSGLLPALAIGGLAQALARWSHCEPIAIALGAYYGCLLTLPLLFVVVASIGEVLNSGPGWGLPYVLGGSGIGGAVLGAFLTAALAPKHTKA